MIMDMIILSYFLCGFYSSPYHFFFVDFVVVIRFTVFHLNLVSCGCDLYLNSIDDHWDDVGSLWLKTGVNHFFPLGRFYTIKNSLRHTNWSTHQKFNQIILMLHLVTSASTKLDLCYYMILRTLSNSAI